MCHQAPAGVKQEAEHVVYITGTGVVVERCKARPPPAVSRCEGCYSKLQACAYRCQGVLARLGLPANGFFFVLISVCSVLVHLGACVVRLFSLLAPATKCQSF